MCIRTSRGETDLLLSRTFSGGIVTKPVTVTILFLELKENRNLVSSR